MHLTVEFSSTNSPHIWLVVVSRSDRGKKCQSLRNQWKMRSIICLMIFQLVPDEWSNWEEMHIIFFLSLSHALVASFTCSSACPVVRSLQLQTLHAKWPFENKSGWMKLIIFLNGENSIYRYFQFISLFTQTFPRIHRRENERETEWSRGEDDTSRKKREKSEEQPILLSLKAKRIN